MILGVGVDIVDIHAFAEQLDDRASSFVEGTFTESERSAPRPLSRFALARRLAARFAAKEAFIKAWSLAYWGENDPLGHVDLRQIELVTDPFGRPKIQLHGEIAVTFQQLGDLDIHISLSHDGGYAVAFVVLEKSQRL